MRLILQLSVLLVLLLCGVPAAQAQVTGVGVTVSESGADLLRFASKKPIAPKKHFQLSNPDRLVIDLPKVEARGVKLPDEYSGTLVKALRFGQFDATTTRLVLDLNAPVTLVSVKAGAPFTLEIKPAGGGRAAKPEVAENKPAKPSALPLIVIDAGHGGQDPGAIGIQGTREKDVTLNYARALRDALVASKRYRAELTRADDRFIKLPERVAVARAQKANIFISLHADTNPKAEARGFSVYTLSETASDDEAEALAERENKADILPGIDLDTADPDVASILIDLTQRETMNKSSQLADAMVKHLHARITKLPRTHRFAGFRVLKGPDIPSVLIELGFLSNPADERQLLTKEYREAMVRSIIKGIDAYKAGE